MPEEVHLGGYRTSPLCVAMMLGCIGGIRTAVRRGGRAVGHPRSRGTVAAVIFADFDGYTALAERDGDRRAADVATRLGQHARAACVGSARVTKHVGDAVMLTPRTSTMRFSPRPA
jgi:class 3 adenylate cyclase